MAGNIRMRSPTRSSLTESASKNVAGTIRMRSIILAPFEVQDGSHHFTINHDEIFKVDEITAKKLEKEHKAMRLY